MPGKRKKFIDKKNAVTFHLVHRSQRDPLQADDEAPQRVLLPADHKTDAQKEQQREYGVFFEDDYDYMQHLREVDELLDVEPVESFRVQTNRELNSAKPGINLPSNVFGSMLQTDVGLLNKAAPVSGPRPDWDPDIVAGLDDDFDFDNPDNQLEDDFMAAANEDAEQDQQELFDDEDEADIFKPVNPVSFHPKMEVCHDDDDVSSDDLACSDDDYDDDDIGSLGDMNFNNIETKSRFTDYSMTSSVTTRNEGLTLLDDKFEKLFEQYDDDEIGALDHEDIGGCVKPQGQVLAQLMEEFEKQQIRPKMKDVVQQGQDMVDTVSDDDEDDDDDLVKVVVEPPKEKWDCESILSTYSTIYNHPTVISEPKKVKSIKFTKRAGIPVDVLPTRGLTRKQLEENNAPDKGDCANTYRSKNETTEERRERKQAIKEERKARREQKKSNKIAFKNEQVRQEREQMHVKHNIQGLALT